MPTTLAQIRNIIVALVRDDAKYLVNPDDYDLALGRALSHYSQFRPAPLSQSVACGANGQIATNLITGFDEGFIELMQIEYPIIAAGVPYWMERSDWSYEQANTGAVIRFYRVPGPGQLVRFVHFVPHVIPTDEAAALTVRQSDIQAVAQWAAAEDLQMMANKYSSQASEHSIMNADIASFQNKGRDCESRAKTFRSMFYDHLRAAGVRETGEVSLVRG